MFDRIEADINLKYLKVCKWLEVNEKPNEFNFLEQSELIRYISSCRRLGGLFSYLSSIIVKKDTWDQFPCEQKYIGTLYSHAYVLLNIVFNGGRLRYIQEPLVVSRGGNDSFLSLHWMQRTLIDLSGYHSLGNDLIVDKEVKDQFWSIMRYELPNKSIYKTLAASGFANWPEYKELAINIYKIPKKTLFIAEIIYPILRSIYLLKLLLNKIKK